MKRVFTICLFSIALIAISSLHINNNANTNKSNEVSLDKRLVVIKINNLNEFTINKGDKVTVAPDNINFQPLSYNQVSIIDSQSKISKIIKNQDFYIVENMPVFNISTEQGYIEVPVLENQLLLMYNYISDDYEFKIVK